MSKIKWITSKITSTTKILTIIAQTILRWNIKEYQEYIINHVMYHGDEWR